MVKLEARTDNGSTYFWANDPGSPAPESILAFTSKKNAQAFIKLHTLISSCVPQKIANRFWSGWGIIDHRTTEFFTKGDFQTTQNQI